MRRSYIRLIFLCYLFSFPLVAQLRVEVIAVPAYTPTEDTLYLTGSFNDWRPADANFRLLSAGGGRYAFAFQTPMPDFEFKVTRGSWATVEGGPLADPVSNRSYVANRKLRDTVRLAVESWEDMEDRIGALDSLQLRITDLPAATPEGAVLYVTGSFNGWSPRDTAYRFSPLPDGALGVRIPLRQETTEYKITRGTWAAIESRDNGLARPNRIFHLEEGADDFAADVAVANWEDLAGPRLNAYSLFLLLSAVQLILLFVVLLSFRALVPYANRLLAGLMGLIAVAILARLAAFDKEVFQVLPKLILLPDLVYFLAAPLFYGYLEARSRPLNEAPARHLVHLLPFALASAVYVPLLMETDYDFSTRIVNDSLQPRLLQLAAAGWVVSMGYAGAAWWMLRREWEKIDGPVRRLLTVLAATLSLPLVAWTVNLMYRLAGAGAAWSATDATHNWLSDAAWLLLVVVAYPLGFFLLRRPQLFRRREGDVPLKQTRLAGEAALAAVRNPAPAAAAVLPQERQESDEPEAGVMVDPEAENLRQLMQSERPYRDPKLTLAKLAAAAGLPAHQLSRLLNDHFGQNFFDYVNGYRITAFRERIAAGDHRERTLLSLALEVGFNSKTAFNRAFKKQLGQTPRQYLQSADNQPK